MTVRTYGFLVKRFVEWCNGRKVDIRQVARADMQEFIDGIAATLSPRSVHTTFAATRKFLEFTTGDADPAFEKVLLPRIPRKEGAWLDDRQIAEYLRCAAARTVNPYRTVIMLLPFTGLRIEEMLKLKREDITTRDGIPVVIVRGRSSGGGAKGDKDRVVPLSEAAQVVVGAYIKNGAPSTGPLFPAVTADSIRERLSTMKRALGFEKLTPHSLRHTFASAMSRKGVGVRVIQALLGHASLTTTQLYVHTGLEDQARAVGTIMPGLPGHENSE
jgi:site-specific recombinase XerD